MLVRGRKPRFNWWKFVFVFIFVCIVFVGVGFGVNSYTNSPSFCVSCHELSPEYMTFSESSHNQISCVQCHVKPGIKNIVEGKTALLHDVYVHFKNKPQQIIETKKLAVSNQNCLQCHSKNRLVTASGDLKVNHQGHIKKGIPCITCHAGVVHAKIAERTINLPQNLSYWTKENTDKIVKDYYVNPNMGTCIDCHNKVNNGQEPWKDIAYIIPKSSNQTKEGNKLSFEVSANAEVNNQSDEDQDKITQEIILQAIGKQTKNVKISMKCETCHRKIKVPESHNNIQWDVNHGNTAMQELNKCLNCHQDSKWVKEMPEEDIKNLLTLNPQEKGKYTLNYQQVKDESRKNKFCSTCHSEQPPSHSAENRWAIEHAANSLDDKSKLKCYICHDKEKPKNEATFIKAPAVYCEYCHTKGFSGILNNKIGD